MSFSSSESASEMAPSSYTQLPTAEVLSYDFIYPKPTSKKAKDTTELVVLSTSATVAGRVAKALEGHSGNIYLHNGESYQRYAKTGTSLGPSLGPTAQAVYLLDFENSAPKFSSLISNQAVVPIAKYLVHPDEPRLEDLPFSCSAPHFTVTTQTGVHTVPVLYKKFKEQRVAWSQVLKTRQTFGSKGTGESKGEEKELKREPKEEPKEEPREQEEALETLEALYAAQPMSTWWGVLLAALTVGSVVAYSVLHRGLATTFGVEKPEPVLSKITHLAVVADRGLSKFEPVKQVLTQVRLALFAWLLSVKNWVTGAARGARASATKADDAVVSKVNKLFSHESRASKHLASKVERFVSSRSSKSVVSAASGALKTANSASAEAKASAVSAASGALKAASSHSAKASASVVSAASDALKTASAAGAKASSAAVANASDALKSASASASAASASAASTRAESSLVSAVHSVLGVQN